MRLQGKTAIITGATGGIGEAAVKLFLDEGANVMAIGRSQQKLSEMLERLKGDERVAHHVADAVDEAATAAATAATVKVFGGVDILIANAGTEGTVKPLEEQTMAEFESVLQTNVLGVWLSMKHCIAPMKKSGAASIVALSSVAGVIGFPGLMPYIASKHAVYGMVKTAALELAADNIRVNAIGPGPIANRMIRAIEEQMAPDNPDSVTETLLETIPMKRYGTSEEVARLALFLASDDSSYCTGGIHMIDGGLTAA